MRSPLSASLFVVALAALGGCTHPQPSPVAAPPAQPKGRPQSPLLLTWEQRALSGSAASLVAHVKRVAPINMPMLVRIEVPAGAKLTAGRAQFVLPANVEASDVAEVVELTFASAPADDLMLRVDSESQAAGFHLWAAYRFGRAEPAAPAAVQPEGPPVKKGDRNLGPSVPLK